MTSLPTASLDKLSTLGLVTGDQRSAILAHPAYAAFAALATPDQQLFWAYRQGLISHHELDAMTTLEHSERARIVAMVNDRIADDICAHHRQLLDQLQRLGLITAGQREQSAPEDYLWRIACAADMLYALYEDGVVAAPDLLHLRERVQADKHSGDGGRRAQIVDEVCKRLQATCALAD